jgi:hypothetical protein
VIQGSARVLHDIPKTLPDGQEAGKPDPQGFVLGRAKVPAVDSRLTEGREFSGHIEARYGGAKGSESG